MTRLSWAHPLDVGYMTILADGSRLQVKFELNPALMKDFDSATGLLFKQKNQPCSAQGFKTSKEEQISRLEFEVICANENLITLELPFIDKAPATFQLIGRFVSHGIESVFNANRQKKELDLEFASEIPFTEFVFSGMQHIGATIGEWHGEDGLRLPDGIDHILFIAAMMLAGGTVWQMLMTATGFTLSHSVTLSLSTLGLIKAPASIIEPAIALSIAFMAAENIFFKVNYKKRWILSFLFGLLHGFGFASVLQELKLQEGHLLKTLIGFNLGVEAGQAIIIATLLPVFILIQKWPARQKLITNLLSGSICCVSLYWFAQRAF